MILLGEYLYEKNNRMKPFKCYVITYINNEKDEKYA